MYNIIHVCTYVREIFRIFSFFNVFWWTLQQVIILKENSNSWVPGNKQDRAQFTLSCIFPCLAYFLFISSAWKFHFLLPICVYTVHIHECNYIVLLCWSLIFEVGQPFIIYMISLIETVCCSFIY